jgi:tetratricopeptide (TPR) repeat protein
LNEFFFAHSWFDGAETFERLASASVQRGGLDPSPPVALAAHAYRAGLASALGYDEELDRLALACLPRLREHGMERELGWCLLALGMNGCYRDVYREAAGHLVEAVATARSARDALLEAAALSWLGFVQLLLDELAGSRASFEACHTKAAELGNPQMLAYALSKLGILADAEQSYAAAMRLHMQANELFTGVGDAGGAGYTLSRASLSAYGTEDYEEALRLGRAGYAAFSEVNHRWGTIAALCRIGFAALALDELDEAQQSFRAALERANASQAVSLELLALTGMGALLRETGEPEQAAALLTFALGHEQLPPSYSIAARPALEALEAELPPEQLAAARDAAAARSLDDFVEQALAVTAPR